MKKIVSLALAVMMLVSVVPMVYAADVDYTNGTAVTYAGTGTEEYTVTVPAELAPGESGTVTLEGTLPSNHAIKVTSDTEVELVNSIDGDTYCLEVHFDGIQVFGNNYDSAGNHTTVSVDAMPNEILFGTLSGKFNYYVEIIDMFATPGAMFAGEVFLPWDEVILEENGELYGYGAYNLSDDPTSPDYIPFFDEAYDLVYITLPEGLTIIGADRFNGCNCLQSVTIPESVTRIDMYAFANCLSLNNIIFQGTVEQWKAITFENYWNLNVPVKEVKCSDGTVSQLPISFTIGDIEEYDFDILECQADPGMTWAQWVVSDYNTYGFEYDIAGNTICLCTSNGGAWWVADRDYEYIDAASTIIAGYAYRVEG